jgi:transcriptional regulator with XRE-family HTH domain
MRTVSTKNVGIKIKPGQCRAARALLEITQAQLAEISGLGLSTVVDFEKSRRAVSEEAIFAIQAALENAVEFIDENGGGPGVRLKKRQTSGHTLKRGNR